MRFEPSHARPGGQGPYTASCAAVHGRSSKCRSSGGVHAAQRVSAHSEHGAAAKVLPSTHAPHACTTASAVGEQLRATKVWPTTVGRVQFAHTQSARYGSVRRKLPAAQVLVHARQPPIEAPLHPNQCCPRVAQSRTICDMLSGHGVQAPPP